MNVEEYKKCPVLIVGGVLEDSESRALDEIFYQLECLDLELMESQSAEEALPLFHANPDISCILLNWNLDKKDMKAVDFIKNIRERNIKIPIFIITDRLSVKDIPLEVVENTTGYVWLMEDTSDFIAGRIDDAVKVYMGKILPPFFNELVDYVDKHKYAWHTPGHMGGMAFRKSAAGRFFFDFFGENAFRADLSVSVPELGSLLEHSEVVGDAEREAAENFNADRTYFVTNGTSTANKIVFHGSVTAGDIVVADRNCHKSVMHAIMMTGTTPVYFIPSRNAYGIIGPIHNREFEEATINKKIRECPLIKSTKKAKLAVVTNSTYDGLCYNVEGVKWKLKEAVENLHFDEAWYGYACFHEMYAGRYGMHTHKNIEKFPAVFATQSTHKVLAAFSQGSMVHVKNGKRKVDHDRFNEAYMMHTSTSPQYEIIASLDVASRMMEEGKYLVDDAIHEAVIFRKKMAQTSKGIKKQKKEKNWWFGVWQPEKVKVKGKSKPIEDVDDEFLKNNPDCWTLKSGEKWHGFGNLEKDHILLDPLKVTILMPGVNEKGMDKWGIPAGIVSKFLMTKGIVVEKTGHYSFLVLFTIGVTKGKSGALLNELFEFKRLYDENVPLESVFPELVKENPEKYKGFKLREFCQEMHEFLMKEKITDVVQEIYSVMPEQKMIPADAYKMMVQGKVEKLQVNKLNNKVSAAMVVPYPPGIPVIMPGEKFTSKTRKIIDYLAFCEEFDNRYPGFENEVHGVLIEQENGRKKYTIHCIS